MTGAWSADQAADAAVGDCDWDRDRVCDGD